MYELDRDTQLSPQGSGHYAGQLPDRYNVGPVPNGGFLMCWMLAAVQQEVVELQPLSTTAHFMKPAKPGAGEVAVEVIKRGRRYATAEARLLQDGGERVRLLTTLGPLGDGGGERYAAAHPPDLSNLPASDERPDSLPEIARRFEVRAEREGMGWLFGQPNDRAEIRARVAFADRRPPDARALVLVADALPPPAFNVLTPGWIPTLELTVHVRARPSGTWLDCVFRTRTIADGLLEEDGELWDERGVLVAQSRQLAVVPDGALLRKTAGSEK